MSLSPRLKKQRVIGGVRINVHQQDQVDSRSLKLHEGESTSANLHSSAVKERKSAHKKASKLPTKSKKAGNTPATHSTIYRVVVNNEGKIIFAHQDFFQSAIQSSTEFRAGEVEKNAEDAGEDIAHISGTIILRDILNFVHPEDALHDRPSFGLFHRPTFYEETEDATATADETIDEWCQSILDGEHEVILTLRSKMYHLKLRFDRMDLREQKSCLIISLDPNITHSSFDSKLVNRAEAGFTEPMVSSEEIWDLMHSGHQQPHKPSRASLKVTTSKKPRAIKINSDKESKKNPSQKSFKVSNANSSQKSLYNADDHMAVFVTMGHDFLILMSSSGQIVECNDIFTQAVGYTSKELKNRSFLDLIYEDDKSAIQPIFKTLMSSTRDETCDSVPFLTHGPSLPVVNCECRIVTSKGDVFWLDCRIKLVEGQLYLVARDLTQAKVHEHELLRREQQLSEAQSIGHMGHWVWYVGDEKLEFSDEIFSIFGQTRDDFIPTIDGINNVLHRRDRGRMAQAFQRALIERKNYQMEFRIVRPDNNVRFILLQGRCETDESGDVISLFGIMQDITQRTQYERELCDAKESAERAYAAKSQFLANMSHELRTPLNAIIGFSEMIEKQMLGPIGTPKYIDYIVGIRESGEHLLDLISDILDMSKIEAGKYTLDLEEFNLLKILRLAVHMMEGRALEAGVKIFSSIPDGEDLPMRGDRRAIMQMILNVLSNAVKFTEDGGEVRLYCQVRHSGDLSIGHNDDIIEICIEDTGIGIPASKLPYVTKPFEQAANHFTRNHEGSGLGLAITKELAELHGGNLIITSKLGVGTSVTMSIPRYPAQISV